MSYNGWRNRQTWILNVHDFYYKAFEGCKFDSVEDLADAMENMFHEFIDENSQNLNLMICDLITKSDIDFQTLAEHYAADNEGVIRADENEDENEDEDEDEDEENCPFCSKSYPLGACRPRDSEE
jgi:hypothetical protein